MTFLLHGESRFLPDVVHGVCCTAFGNISKVYAAEIDWKKIAAVLVISANLLTIISITSRFHSSTTAIQP